MRVGFSGPRTPCAGRGPRSWSSLPGTALWGWGLSLWLGACSTLPPLPSESEAAHHAPPLCAAPTEWEDPHPERVAPVLCPRTETPAPGCGHPESSALNPASPGERTAVPAPRGQLKAVSFNTLPRWHYALTPETWTAFLHSCTVLIGQVPFQSACQAAMAWSGSPDAAQMREFFETHFSPWQVLNPDGSNTGLITGYYEPLLHGSLTPTPRYRYPLYRPPGNLLTIDLGDLVPELKGRRLRGQLQGNRVVPYLQRADIDSAAEPLRGEELVWVDDPVDLFFLQIQGSGRIDLAQGGQMRVGYADQNGQPFHGIGRLLVQQGALTLGQATLSGIKAWARSHPQQVSSVLNHNPSYVFFRILPADLPGPLGALGVPVTGGASLAVDPRVIPLGVPVFLDTTRPATHTPLRRLMMAQDTGGAIFGAVRADFFWGYGPLAEHEAGTMRQSGRLWILYPTGFTPPGAS